MGFGDFKQLQAATNTERESERAVSVQRSCKETKGLHKRTTLH